MEMCKLGGILHPLERRRLVREMEGRSNSTDSKKGEGGGVLRGNFDDDVIQGVYADSGRKVRGSSRGEGFISTESYKV